MKNVIRRCAHRVRRDQGFTLIELVAAVSIMFVGFFTLAGAFASGTRLIVQARQRQVATEEANGELEHLRNIPYDNVSLAASPSHSSDTGSPDYYVNNGATGYDYLHGGTYETLVVDTSTPGAVSHGPEQQTIGSTLVTTYRYVTWIDDPVGGATAQDYKRLTVVVAYSAADNAGRPHSVQVSALFTLGSVTVTGSSSNATTGTSPTASPSPSPTPTPSGPCDGDTHAPGGDFSFLSGAGSSVGYTGSTTTTVSLAPVDNCTPIQIQLSNDGGTYASWFTFNATTPTVTWSIPSGDGVKSVWAHFTDGNENQGTVGPHSVTLDATKPTVPGTLSRTVSCQGSNRTVNLSWGASTDTNLLGYRVYKQTNGAGYLALLTTSTQTASDTHSKGLNSVDFKVVAYDKAGNEGNATNVVSLAKNKCS